MGRLGRDRVRLRRGNCVLAAGFAISVLAATPRLAASASMPSGIAEKSVVAATTGQPNPAVAGIPRSALEEFKSLCSGLEAARAQLASGKLTADAFADTLLALFARADTLAQLLATAPRGPSWLTMQRGMGYLIESLRENWVGIAAQNGMSFAEADSALKAAVAWRSDVTESATP